MNFTRLAILVTEILADALYDLLVITNPNVKARNQCDVTFLYSEHRKQNKYVPSSGYWGKVYKIEDIPSTSICPGDDIERIRLMRNRLNHSSHYEIEYKEFDALDKLIQDVLTRMYSFMNLITKPTYMERAAEIRGKAYQLVDLKCLKNQLEKGKLILI